jgi:peroxiredoxin
MLFQFLLSLLSIWSFQGTERTGIPVQLSIGDSLTVYVFLHDECVISQFYTPELSRLYETYRSRKVGFVGYFPNPATTADRIEAFGRDFHLDFPLLEDYKKAITRQFGITVTPEVAVWDHRTGWQIYRGRIDDSYVRVGKRKTHPQAHDLEDTIESWIRHESPQLIVQTQAIGCLINFTD